MGSSTKSLIKDVVIIVVAIAVIWLGLQAVFGTANPFYVVSSGSMIPALEVYDVIVVEGNTPFEDIEKGDIIVFYSPKLYEQGKERVIVHRVSLDMSTDAQKIVRTKGDANPSSIAGTDYPITEKEYLGQVEYVIPQVGYITQILQPPINYIIIAVIIGVMVVKHFAGKEKKKIEFQYTKDSSEVNEPDNSLEENKDLNPLSFRPARGILSQRLQQALEDLKKPFFYDLSNLSQGVKIAIQLDKDLLIINVDKDRLYSELAFVFLLWMFFASLVLLILAYFFMKGQIRPLKRLAIIAETFGRGLDAPEIKTSGALEIRQTSKAFNQMRTRIKRFLKQRTDMLAGVSHDLRSPLTRMKLQLSLLKDEKARSELELDIKEMTAMLDSYVSFVRTEAPEPIDNISICLLYTSDAADE